MKKLGNFQLIVLIVFVALAVFGVLVFAGIVKIGGKDEAVVTGSVVLWGTAKADMMNNLINNFTSQNKTLTVKYVQKNRASFDQDLLEALATNTGPDLFILPDDMIVHFRNKIMPIPYASFPQATFQNTFAGAGEIYLSEKGTLALPLSIDPMIMYYNRSHLDAEGIVTPPVYWNDLESLVPVFTKKDQDRKITKSAFALGQFSNILHAKDIISMIFMQLGNPIVREKNGTLLSVLNNDGENTLGGNLSSVLRFYTSFADPANSLYSWNRSLQNSRDAFSSEKLTFYFGFASELADLTARNPNENFYIAPVPQIKNSNFKLTFGHTQAVAISASTKNPTVAFTVAGLLATGDFSKQFANNLLLAPARRDLLNTKPTDAYFPVFYNSALFARSWLDPAPAETDAVFQRMVENVLSNNLSIENSISDASSKLNLLLSK
ncbi:MAG: extracellular solute-binding protein [Patescibacteria group bacterium]